MEILGPQGKRGSQDHEGVEVNQGRTVNPAEWDPPGLADLGVLRAVLVSMEYRDEWAIQVSVEVMDGRERWDPRGIRALWVSKDPRDQQEQGVPQGETAIQVPQVLTDLRVTPDRLEKADLQETQDHRE